MTTPNQPENPQTQHTSVVSVRNAIIDLFNKQQVHPRNALEVLISCTGAIIATFPEDIRPGALRSVTEALVGCVLANVETMSTEEFAAHTIWGESEEHNN